MHSIPGQPGGGEARCHDSLDVHNSEPVRSRSPVRADGTPSDPRHPWNTDGNYTPQGGLASADDSMAAFTMVR
jgi:hypothetical protein